MRTERELMKEILEAALIKSVKSPDYSQVFFKDEHDILVHQGVIGYGKPNEKCDRIFNPWEIEEVLDYFLGPEEEENYELEAKDDKEQSKLTLAVEEAKKEAKIEVLTELRTRYTDLYNECAKVGGEELPFIKFKMDIYQDFIRDIEKILKDLE